jgi:hypothetical protein
MYALSHRGISKTFATRRYHGYLVDLFDRFQCYHQCYQVLPLMIDARLGARYRQ